MARLSYCDYRKLEYSNHLFLLQKKHPKQPPILSVGVGILINEYVYFLSLIFITPSFSIAFFIKFSNTFSWYFEFLNGFGNNFFSFFPFPNQASDVFLDSNRVF